MAFRDLIPKYQFKKKEGKYESKKEADRKIPGQPVKVSSGNEEADFNKVVIQTALDHVTRRISQPTRDLYQGKVNAEMRNGSTEMIVKVELTHLSDRSTIVGSLILSRVCMRAGLSTAREKGKVLGDILVRELSEKHKHPRRPDPRVMPDGPGCSDEDDDGRTLDQIERDDRILELMKQPICPICGPASIDFPDWDEDCGHDY